MGRSQWIVVAVAVGLVLLTYFGCPVRPPEGGAELDRSPLEATGLQSLIRAARADLRPATMATLASLEDRLKSQTDPERRLDLLEQLAGEWYRAGHPAVSGVYARDIAEERATAEAWSIAGTTFSLCLQKEDADQKTRQFCGDQAEKAYEAAISLDPDNADHRINLATSYMDNPSSENPMRGVMLLRDLAEEYPENARVFITLGRLSLRSGQLENAAKRYGQAAELAPNDPDAICPLARVYDELGEAQKASELGQRCAALLEELQAARAEGNNG